MIERIDVTLDGLRGLVDRIDLKQLEASDWPVVGALVGNFLAREEGKVERLMAKLAAQQNQSEPPPSDPAESQEQIAQDQTQPAQDANKKKGHGRNPSVAFTQAGLRRYELPDDVIGSCCSDCQSRLKRYRNRRVVRVVGQPLFEAEIHEIEQARCPGCGKVIAAQAPANLQAGIGKHVIYDWTACAMLLVLHYTCGMPFKRLEALHKSWGIPFSDANQWAVVNGAIDLLQPLLKAIEDYAIENVRTIKIDDTGSMVLDLHRQITGEVEVARALGLAPNSVRTGINATCARMEMDKAMVIMYFTGRHHAGEICDRILAKRLLPAADKVIKISDAASKNFDHAHPDLVVEAACNAHALLKFRDIKEKFPKEYELVGEAYSHVFENDALTRKMEMTPQERLKYHQNNSRSWMEKIRRMCTEKIESRLVEPRSPLWGPITFIINQWPRLTKFLEQPGVPLDTNFVEQDLIIPVRYLSASFNYQTINGAEVGDAAMSLIATARASGAEPVGYLAHCLENNQDLKLHPEKYLPWVYRQGLERKARAPNDDTIH